MARARHENAATSGHDRASFENLDQQDPEMDVLVAAHGREFVPVPGMSREETKFWDPSVALEDEDRRGLKDELDLKD